MAPGNLPTIQEHFKSDSIAAAESVKLGCNAAAFDA
jgi:hypothetical protein